MTVIEMQYMEAVKSIARSLNKPKEIDWEQRRYEIAKDFLANAHGNPNYAHGNLDACVYDAVLAADALVEELKKTTEP